MPNLLYRCLPIEEKRFYFIINTIDLVFFTINIPTVIFLLFQGKINALLGGIFILGFISLILAFASMYIYMTKKNYQSHAHVAYFYFQLFEAIIIFIGLSIIFINFILGDLSVNDEQDRAMDIVWFTAYVINLPPVLLNLYWRKTLVEMLDN